MEYMKYRVTKQIIINLLVVAQGMIIEMSGVSLLDLRAQVGYNYEEMARALALQSAGVLCGAVSGGFLHEIFYSHTEAITLGGILLMGLAQATIPWLLSGAILSTAMFAIGIGQGFLNTGMNPLVMTLWGKHAASPLHSLHFSSTFGAVITTQITRPFLRPKAVPQNYTATDDHNSTELSPWPSNLHNSTVTSPSNLLVPYTISAVWTFVFGLLLAGYIAKGPPRGFPQRKPHDKIKELLSPGSCNNGRVIYGSLLLLTLYLFFSQAVGLERIFGKYLFPFALGANTNCSNDQAAMLVTAFYIGMMFGRFSGMFVSHVISTPWLIFVDVICIIVTVVVGALFAYDNIYALWAVTILAGVFTSILFPAGMAWANLHMETNSMVVMLMMMGSASGSFAYQYVTGSLFHRYGLHCFLYVSVTCACAISIVFIVMTAIVRGKNAHDVTEMVIGVEGDALEVTYSKENESSQIKSPEDGLEVTQPLNVVET